MTEAIYDAEDVTDENASEAKSVARLADDAA